MGEEIQPYLLADARRDALADGPYAGKVCGECDGTGLYLGRARCPTCDATGWYHYDDAGKRHAGRGRSDG